MVRRCIKIMSNLVVTLDNAIRKFEAAEANLSKLERLWDQIQHLTPSGIIFGSDEEYEDLCRAYSNIIKELPKIDGWKPTSEPIELDGIAQSRLDAKELGEIGVEVSVERWIEEPGRELREYRFKFNQKRRQLIRQAVSKVITDVNNMLSSLDSLHQDKEGRVDLSEEAQWVQLKEKIKELNTLLGSSVPRPSRWSDLHRHLHFGMLGDLFDIINHDWPTIKDSLMKSLYDQNDPIPTGINDLSELVAKNPTGSIVTKLSWDKLSPDEFERLIFTLISSEEGYENPEWLMHTNAPDKGRDLSVYRIIKDNLSGVIRKRVIIQCKHYLTKSISPIEIAVLKEQVKHWEPPRLDVVVIATSGRFTADAVSSIEKHNQSDSALSIEMWPESHLENLLVRRPSLLGEFNLR
jgi:hypothetical protein